MSPDILEFESPKSHQLTSRAAFDNGHLKTNPDEARKLIEGLVSIMSDQQFDPKHPLLIAFRSIWLRLCHVSVRLSTLLYNADKYCRLRLKAITRLLSK